MIMLMVTRYIGSPALIFINGIPARYGLLGSPFMM